MGNEREKEVNQRQELLTSPVNSKSRWENHKADEFAASIFREMKQRTAAYKYRLSRDNLAS
jgi:hypothetical protein